MTNQVQVPDWWHRNDRDPHPTRERTAVRHYAKLASDVEWAVAARDGITETQLLALRDAYFAALDATAILHDGTEQRRRIIKAMRRLRQSGVPFVSRMAQEVLEDQRTRLVRLDPARRGVVTD
jgi:hypothetical protein